jgi:hypothetical protein
MEEIAQRGRDMSEFKVGDRVICVKSSDFYIGGEAAQKGFEGVVAEIRNSSLRFKENTGMYLASRFELIQDNKEKEVPDTEKKYKITTELTLQEVANLKRAIVYATGFGGLRKELDTIYREAQRKVVKVGDKEYYEDELSAALANIKPIK